MKIQKMMALDADTIAALLRDEGKRKTKTTTGGDSSKYAVRCIQMGPLKWVEDYRPCGFTTGIGCGSPTRIRINGQPWCTTHALNYLNKLELERDGVRLEDCTCEQGKYSQGNVHHPNCEMLGITTAITAEDIPTELDDLL